jgi:antitoxin component YwqK of YwqJK toxin-antitoxin module
MSNEDKIQEEYYDTGELKYKGTIHNDKMHGLWEWYYPDGSLCTKGEYINGIRDGLWLINYNMLCHVFYSI